MSSRDDQWAALSSRNERVIQLDDPGVVRAEQAAGAARTQWAELASRDERLANTSDPLYGLARSNHGQAGLRLVKRVA
jgi:hypothetical protein